MKRNKLYTKADATRESKLYYVFCEGEKTEPQYFHFFNRIASQIIIQNIRIEDGNNSPTGLYNCAYKSLIEKSSSSFYELCDDDEVWFVIDTDAWEDKIDTLREEIKKHSNWYVAQSNPCFEVWLYYHFFADKPTEAVTDWKQMLNERIPGGFDARKHPYHIETAIKHAHAAYPGQPEWACTEVQLLAERFLPLVIETLRELSAPNS